MKTIIIMGLLGLCSCMPNRKISEPSLASGGIYLKSGELLHARMEYLERYGSLVTSRGEGHGIYTTFQVDAFFFYDEGQKKMRRYRNLEHKGRERFFEVLYSGKLEVLRLKREAVLPAGTLFGNIAQKESGHSLFILYQNELMPLNRFGPKSLASSFPMFYDELENFCRYQGFSIYRSRDRLYIVEELDRLLRKKNKGLNFSGSDMYDRKNLYDTISIK